MPGSVALPGSTKSYDTAATASALVERDSTGGVTASHFLSTQATAPTAAAGSNAGTSPPAPVVASGSTDAAGSVTGGTGTSPSAGNLIVVTFNQAFATAPKVTVSPANAATAALLPYVTSVSTTGFTIAVQGAPAASQANTTYAFTWHAIG